MDKNKTMLFVSMIGLALLVGLVAGSKITEHTQFRSRTVPDKTVRSMEAYGHPAVTPQTDDSLEAIATKGGLILQARGKVLVGDNEVDMTVVRANPGLVCTIAKWPGHAELGLSCVPAKDIYKTVNFASDPTLRGEK